MHKIILLFCLVVVAVAQYEEKYEKVVDFYAQPKYKFQYSVEDPHTLDIKKQEESREGKLTKGYYTLKEADGKSERKVQYTVESQLKKKY